MKANKYEIKGYIYITSEEEIKEGNWFIGDNVSLKKCTINNAGNIGFKGGWYSGSKKCKKIILTTNPNLPIQQLTPKEIEYLKVVDSCEVEKLTLNSFPVRGSYKLIIAKKN